MALPVPIRRQNDQQKQLTKEEKEDLKIRELQAEEARRLKEVVKRPIQAKRKTLVELVKTEPSHINLLRLANSTYNEEINKYNVSFAQSDVI